MEFFIYTLDVSSNCKSKLFLAYERFCKANNISYDKPKKLLVQPYTIRIPTEQRIDLVIACCGWVYTTVFNISKHGLRPDEISKLRLRDVDLERGVITVPTSKLGAHAIRTYVVTLPRPLSVFPPILAFL